MAETVLIATMVDLVIVVVDARRFNPERLQQCLLRLDTANTNVAIVLNRVRFNRQRRDGTYGYGHFRRADAPPAASAPVGLDVQAPPARAPRAPVSNGRRRRGGALRRPARVGADRAAVVGGRGAAGAHDDPTSVENPGQTGYWQR